MNVQVKSLIVKYNNKIVGFLEEVANKRIAFQYDESWIKDGFSISPLSLPLDNKVYIATKPYFEGLFGVFYDSLPDGWGELLMRRMLLNKGIDFDRLSPLTKLSLVNNNGLGGLTYEPTQSETIESQTTDLDKLAQEISHIYDYTETTQDFDEIYTLGGASGGARPKVHMIIDGQQWIIKFHSSMDPKEIGFLEYKANQLAELSDINVNTYQLFPSHKHKGYFGAKRFDRDGSKRYHVISLSALLETSYRIPNLDYSHLFQVVLRICVDPEDIYEAYKRMCFNVLYGNRDDHGKNFAFMYDESIGGYRLTPFYDITKTNDKLEHEMTVLNQGKPTESDLLDFAKEFNLSIKRCTDIIDKIKDIIGEQ